MRCYEHLQYDPKDDIYKRLELPEILDYSGIPINTICEAEEAERKKQIIYNMDLRALLNVLVDRMIEELELDYNDMFRLGMYRTYMDNLIER